MLVVALAPLGVAVIVLRNGGAKATAFDVHVTTAVLVPLTVSGARAGEHGDQELNAIGFAAWA
jgi:hypothetical protein